MKALILSVATGGGHLTSSNAICEYFESQGHEAMVVDTYEYVAPLINNALSKGYLASTKYLPRVYGKVYTKCEKMDSTTKRVYPVKALNMFAKGKFIKLINSYKPDFIICSHVMASLLIESIRNKFEDKSVLHIGLVTDFTLHPYWEDTDCDFYITPSELINLKMSKKGIDTNKIKAFGIPVETKFAKKLDKSEARKILGIEDKKTILVMSGSMGYGKIHKSIGLLDKLDEDFQMIVVCGTNKKLKKRIEKMKFSKNIYVHGFTDKVDIMMSASDCVVTKPGGLSISEALAKEMPIILANPIPGQEDRNLEFLINNGAVQAVTSTYSLDEAVYQLLGSEWRYELARNNVKFFSKPNATEDLCQFLIKEKEKAKNV